MNIVKELTIDHLYEMVRTGIEVYSKNEADYLLKNAYYTFTNTDFPKNLNDKTRIEVNQKTFNTVVRLSSAIFNGQELEDLLTEKVDDINPVLKLFLIDEIKVNEDMFKTFAEIENKGLEVLRITTEGLPYKLIKRNSNNTSFQDEVDDLTKYFDNAPKLVCGSALEEKDFEDVDFRIYVPEITAELYRNIAGKQDQNRNPKLDIVLIPQEHYIPFYLSDSSQNDSPENSVIVDSSINYVKINKDRLRALRFAHIAVNYMRLRKSLTHEMIEKCAKVLKRLNSRGKATKFLHRDKCYLLGRDLPKSDRFKFDKMPGKDEMINALVKVNFSAYKLMSVYQAYHNI